MPNGGEHNERLGSCPRCGSLNIRTRRQRHRRFLWRCRACNRVFETPKVGEYVIPPGDDGRGYAFAESVPQMERRASRHSRSRRSSTAPKLIAAMVLVIAVGAVGYFVFMGDPGLDIGGSGQRPSPDEPIAAAVPQSPTPILAASMPTPIPSDTPTPTRTPTPQPSDTPTPTGRMFAAAGTPTPAARPVQPASRTPTPTPTNTPTPVPSNTLAPTNTPTPVSTSTPIPTNTPTPLPTSTPTPTNTPTPLPTNTPMPTNTPVPVVKLVLDAESTVVGYWSDGTADVEVTATLRNEGRLRLDGARELTVTCISQGDERRDCREDLSLSLPDGFAPASDSFILQLPMGATILTFDYGGDEPLTLDIDVPERILGVDRDVWECYADRPPEGFAIGPHNDWVAGCGGWVKPTVEKWLNDVPVKVWATGDPTHIAILETVLAELAPILNLEFEWVDAEEGADFTAFVGVPRSEADSLGVSDPFYVHEAWGFGSANVNRGEATSGRMVIWHLDLTGFRSPIDEIRAVTIHEALHALGPIAHRTPLGHSSRPLSVMEVSKRGVLIPRERQLLEINSHPLVRPGMSMDEVRELIVLTEELLDYLLIESKAAPDDPLDLVRRAYVELERAGSASFRLSGGWTGDESCNQPFGVRHGPIEMSIRDFSLTGDWQGLDPALVLLDFGTSRFLIRREDGEWNHWWLTPGGARETVYREAVETASSYWLWNGKLLTTLRSVLWDGSSDDISVEETADGNLRFQVTLDHSYIYMWDWKPVDMSLDFTLVVDPETYAIVWYTWELHRDPDVHSGPCLTYTEVATDGLLGVDMDRLIDQPEVASEDSLDTVWKAYLALEKAGSASFRLSGGWVDRACNLTFGVRRGPIEMAIGDFRYFNNEPVLLYLDLHTTQFYIIYSRADQGWTHWQLSPEGAWEKVDGEAIWDATSWWVWNGKLHAAIQGVLMYASPEDVRVDETSDGNLSLQVTLDEYYVNLWDWTPGDSVDFTLVVNPDTFDVVGYTWELNKDPAKHPNACLTYKEVATDGRLGVEIEVPESIRNQLAASP